MGSLVPVHVSRLAPGQRSCHAVVVMATLVDDRRLAFTVPMGEATRLAGALGLAPQPNPLCELVFELIQRVEASVNQAVIDLDEGTVTGRLVLAHGAVPFTLACHPADALTLAIRAGAPVFATPALLAVAESVARPAADGDSAVRRWLADVLPDDFAAGDA